MVERTSLTGPTLVPPPRRDPCGFASIRFLLLPQPPLPLASAPQKNACDFFLQMVVRTPICCCSAHCCRCKVLTRAYRPFSRGSARALPLASSLLSSATRSPRAFSQGAGLPVVTTQRYPATAAAANMRGRCRALSGRSRRQGSYDANPPARAPGARPRAAVGCACRADRVRGPTQHAVERLNAVVTRVS